MSKILKHYIMPSADVQHIEVPIGSQLISVIEQRDCIVVYALVDDPDREKEKVPVMCVGTGWDIKVPDDHYILRLIGTVKVGELVWHVLELQDINELPF
ncbi:MAG: hypothetical protein P0Y55_11840 [Candidatus Cohnella colombiensis]|uniref:DUF7352 domain-containing protein n=1 Tax=Candidatus Cohnella colombiensis TaxID=3121368 RepID=A0AA95ETQ9_9BACL|nr:MAG: hypothetical protein P0Y55_11840 [Cohnella sp.]